MPHLGALPPVLIPGFSGQGLGFYHLGWSPEGRWAGLISYARPAALYLLIVDTVNDAVLLRSRQAGWDGSVDLASFWDSGKARLTAEVQGYGVEMGRKTDVRGAEFLTGGIRYEFMLNPESPAGGPYALEIYSRLRGRKTVYRGDGKGLRRVELPGCLVSPFESRAMAVVREEGTAGGWDYRFVGAHLLIGFQAVSDQPETKRQSLDLVSPVINGQVNILEARLSAGADANQADSRGFAVIVMAARLGHWEMVERLLAAGARPNARDVGGRTALHYAAFFGQEATVRALLANDAGTDLRDAAGRTPGELAAVSSLRALLNGNER